MKFLFLLVIFQQAFQPDAFSLYYNIFTPFCITTCAPHLHCIADNTCGCHKGYSEAISHETGKLFCKSQCEPPCMDNGQCVDVDTCACLEGYELVELDCKPRCSTGCINGYCIAPEECECHTGYKSVGNACIVILEGYIKTTPSTTTTTTRKTIELSTLDSTETEGSTEGSTEESTDGSTEEFTGMETTETTAFTDTDTSSTLDDLLQAEVVENDELPIDDSEICLPDYVLYKGKCFPMIRPSCNKKICGPNSYCVNEDECDCLPGYSWQPNADNKDGSCQRTLFNKKHADMVAVPQDHKNQWTSNMFTVLGMLCVTVAVLGLMSGLYQHYK